MSVTVKWSAYSDMSLAGDLSGFTDEQTTILPGLWADCEANGEGAVNDCLSHYFDTETWDRLIGCDDDNADVVVTVTEPRAIAGEYKVQLTRITHASARKLATA